MKYDIFISYRRTDRELVASVVRRLEARGVGVWYDAEIDGGADWREVIVEALTHSDMLAIFFSEECNNSRQLKKELAVADSLGKPVVPILIENTQPRGAYLYELADRNWIQMWPDPMDRVEELVEHLAVLAGKSEGGLAGGRPSKTLAPVAANDAAPAPAAAPGADDEEQNLDEAVGEFIEEAEQPARSAPKVAKAYVGRVTDTGPGRKLNDVPPFRWIDLAFLAPIWIAAFWYILSISVGVEPRPDADRVVASGVLLGLIGTALYGAVVFPVRYYL
ncbi:MAG TPA: toll/interleukin-1 receptor domain-containing protein, partial [Hyphomonadaceae bacterium]